MIGHLFRICVITFLALVSMILPYLPGQYDGFAGSLSVMAQIFGVIGLLQVPIGILWWVYELRKRSAGAQEPTPTDKGYYFGFATLIVFSIVGIVVSLGAAASMGFSLAVAILGLCSYCFVRLFRKLMIMRNATTKGFNPAPLYLIFLPIVVSICRFAVMIPVAEQARIAAMEHSEALINDIEKYKSTNGYYPASLHAVNQDYSPSIIGVRGYEYELNGDAYNLFFEFPSYALGAREIVMYNKRDEHLAISHDSDILLWTPQELRDRRGYHSVYDGPRPHWRYFWFD